MSLLNKIKKWLSHNEESQNTASNSISNNEIIDTPSQFATPLPENFKPEHSVVNETKNEDAQPENQLENHLQSDDLPNQVVQPESILPELTSAKDFSRQTLDELIQSHKVYHENLIEALRGNNPTMYNAPVSDAKQCTALGHWLMVNQSLLAPYTEYAVLMDMHNAFHDCAGYMIERHRHGSFAEAVLLLRKDVAVLSEEIEKALIRLYDQIQAA